MDQTYKMCNVQQIYTYIIQLTRLVRPGGGTDGALGVMTRTLKRIQSINTKERGLCSDILTEEKIIIKFILKKRGVTSWIGFMWHRANTNSGLIQNDNGISWDHKWQEIYWFSETLLQFLEGVYPMELLIAGCFVSSSKEKY